MSGAPRLKVFNPEGDYVAACKYYEDAACLAALYGPGATVRRGHAKKDAIWTEGAESVSASESYDAAADIMRARRSRRQREDLARLRRVGERSGSDGGPGW